MGVLIFDNLPTVPTVPSALDMQQVNTANLDIKGKSYLI